MWRSLGAFSWSWILDESSIHANVTPRKAVSENSEKKEIATTTTCPYLVLGTKHLIAII